MALSRDLPITTANLTTRPFLESYDDGDTYLKKTISKEHLRDVKRQFRRLAGEGNLVYNVARQPTEIRHG